MSNKHWNEFGRWLSACFAIVCVDILYEMSVQNGCNPHCMSSMQRFGWNRTMLFSFLMCNNWIVAWIEFNWLTFPIFMPSICAWADSRKKEEETGIEESYQNADIALISHLRDLKLNGRWISDWRQGKRRKKGSRRDCELMTRALSRDPTLLASIVCHPQADSMMLE